MSSKTEQNTEDNGRVSTDMVGVNKSGKMVHDMKAIGGTTKRMARERSGMCMVINMRDNGEMIKLMVTEYIRILMERNIRVIGKTIYNMDMESNNGLMVRNMLVTTFRVANTAKEPTLGRTDLNIQEAGRKIKFMAKASTSG